MPASAQQPLSLCKDLQLYLATERRLVASSKVKTDVCDEHITATNATVPTLTVQHAYFVRCMCFIEVFPWLLQATPLCTAVE